MNAHLRCEVGVPSSDCLYGDTAPQSSNRKRDGDQSASGNSKNSQSESPAECAGGNFMHPRFQFSEAEEIALRLQ
jgi:hypothetical protein